MERPVSGSMDLETGINVPKKQEKQQCNSTKYIVQISILILFAIYAGTIKFMSVSKPMMFIERDPSLSYPRVKSQVSNVLLSILSICVPGIIIITHSFIPFPPKTESVGNPAYDFKRRVRVSFWLLCGLGQALLITMSVYNTIKITTGRPRPNILAYCNYKGFNDAMTSGDFTDYNNITAAGTIADIKYCRSSSNDNDDAMRSFPSGHAGLSFSGMIYLSLFLKHAFGIQSFLSVQGIFAASPIYLAGWISITRIQDYYHRSDDVLVGAIIGCIAAYHVWKNIRSIIIGSEL